MHDVAEFLKEHDPFSELDPATLEGLSERVEVEFFPAGMTIFKQGEPSPIDVRIVRRGAVALVDYGRVLDVLGEGELFGHPSMLSGTPPGFEARAHEDSLCYVLAAEDVLPLLTRPAGLSYFARSLFARPKPGPLVAADVSGFDLAQQPVTALIREQPLICEPELAVRDVARRMAETGASSALVRLGDGEYGIVTDRDFRSRVVAEGVSVDAPVSRVMTAPAFTVGPDLYGADVLLAMLDRGIQHVPVLSARAEVLGVVSDIDLLAAETRTPFVLRRAIVDARDVDQLRRAAGRLTPTLIGLHQVDLAPAQISAVISVVVDALIRRGIELATASKGPPPVDFAWLSLGSHGRREGVPSSDIDSGMVWADGRDADPSAYMQSVGEEVVTTLAATGWEADTHGVTASSSISARSVPDWQRNVKRWLDHPDEENVLMALSIVLDGRIVYGPDDALGALAELRSVPDRPAVRRLLLRLALADKPPTGFRRDIVIEHSGENRGSFDIKLGGTQPIVGIARYGGLSAGATVTSTAERLRAAASAGTLTEEAAHTLEEGYDLFAALRLEHQVEQLEAGARPDDRLDPKALSPLTRRYLRDAFRAVASVQKGLAGELKWRTQP
ncbi:MAG: putative nucleotidyltransferase substrate binding domain-containing protein [Gaiellaceae bacterium]